MGFEGRIAAVPPPFDPVRGADAAGRTGVAPGAFRDLLAGAAGSSRFLAGLIETEAEWLADLPGTAPEAALAPLLAPLGTEGPPDAALRLRKRRVALLVALADLGAVWSLSEVTGALTAFADRAVEEALAHHLAEEVRRGRLPPGAGGLVVLAMGKMGAGELNYSSDIDLIALFDEARFAPGDYAEIRAGFVRVVQRMVRTLSAQTAEGYVFRTDLRLRPDPSVTPVCIGVAQAEAYYESQGRTWERAAMIKARPCAGDLAVGAAFLAAIAPFVWRRHLDFAAIEDALDMQRRIRDHKGLHGPLAVPGHDLKLGRGGIRPIEFFAQTRQLICGGRDPSLRTRGTQAALHALAARGWIVAEVAEALDAAYAAHRAVEHRIQMLEDAQTQTVPRAEAARARVACLSGEPDLARFDAALHERLQRVDLLTEALFVRAAAPPAGAVAAEDLAALGYRRADHALALVERWRAGAIPATRSPRARAILARIEGEILRRLAAAASPDDAATRFDAFLSGLPAGVQILSLFEANPQLLDLLADICAASPRLAGELSRRAAVLDAVLDRDFFAPLGGPAALRAPLEDALGRAEDYERMLDAARRWAHEQVFRAGVQLLRGIATPAGAGAAFTAVAETALAALLPRVEAEVAAAHGRLPGASLAVLGMGKLGSREMTITSDLDLILVYDPGGAEASDGRKPLSATAWFARLTRMLVAALTAPTAEGRLYEVDMRLRPSGRKGPVAVSLAAFAGYQRTEAWTWEHMALTRARVVAGDPGLGARVEAEIAAVLALPRDPARVLADAREMRERIAKAQAGAEADVWEVKARPGGIVDIELLLQAGMLVTGLAGIRAPLAAIPELAARGFLSAADAALLSRALSRALAVQQFARLAVAGRFSPEAAGAALVEAMARAAGEADGAALAAALAADAAAAREAIDRRLSP